MIMTNAASTPFTTSSRSLNWSRSKSSKEKKETLQMPSARGYCFGSSAYTVVVLIALAFFIVGVRANVATSLAESSIENTKANSRAEDDRVAVGVVDSESNIGVDDVIVALDSIAPATVVANSEDENRSEGRASRKARGRRMGTGGGKVVGLDHDVLSISASTSTSTAPTSSSSSSSSLSLSYVRIFVDAFRGVENMTSAMLSEKSNASPTATATAVVAASMTVSKTKEDENKMRILRRRAEDYWGVDGGNRDGEGGERADDDESHPFGEESSYGGRDGGGGKKSNDGGGRGGEGMGYDVYDEYGNSDGGGSIGYDESSSYGSYESSSSSGGYGDYGSTSSSGYGGYGGYGDYSSSSSSSNGSSASSYKSPSGPRYKSHSGSQIVGRLLKARIPLVVMLLLLPCLLFVGMVYTAHSFERAPEGMFANFCRLTLHTLRCTHRLAYNMYHCRLGEIPSVVCALDDEDEYGREYTDEELDRMKLRPGIGRALDVEHRKALRRVQEMGIRGGRNDHKDNVRGAGRAGGGGRSCGSKKRMEGGDVSSDEKGTGRKNPSLGGGTGGSMEEEGRGIGTKQDAPRSYAPMPLIDMV